MNLLDEPTFRVQTESQSTRVTLPELFALLGHDKVDSLLGLQRHQEDALHVFLTYLGGVALVRRGETDPSHNAEWWRSALLALSGGQDTPWTLVVPDCQKPAFLQPPLPRSDQSMLKPKAYTPDELDVLQTAKNHDVKTARAGSPDIDEWVYALIAVQTMSGYLGQGHFGIARMNSGFGNRPVIEIVRTFRIGLRWQDAVSRLLRHRDDVLASNFGYDPDGLALVWLEPWDGQKSLPLSRLDPFFIEVCRRIRMQAVSGTLRADFVPSKNTRISARELNGHVGDPWLPIQLETESRSTKGTGAKALTLSASGFTPELLRRLIFQDGILLSRLQRPDPAWTGDCWLTGTALVRGQGTTDGFYETRVRIPGAVQRRVWGPASEEQGLASLSKTAIEHAGKVQQALQRAIFAYIEGGPDRVQLDRDSAKMWSERYMRQYQMLWHQEYFPWLWTAAASQTDVTALREWVDRLVGYAVGVLDLAKGDLPGRSGRRFRATVFSDRLFFGSVYHAFPFLHKETNDDVAAQ